jgi:hypothetical protein
MGRPAPVACPAHSAPVIAGDGGPVSCNTLSDCQPDGSLNFYVACLNGVCSVDQCLADSDCGAGNVCECPGAGGGAVRLGNTCIATSCQVDSNCGANGVCSASTGYCGNVQGYYCHSSSDECLTNYDCCGSTPECAYQPTLGHWACQQATLCAG